MKNIRLFIVIASTTVLLLSNISVLNGMISKGSSTKTIDPRRDMVFIELYGSNTGFTISNKDIEIFKKAFTQKNSMKDANGDDILSFIDCYNRIYLQQKDESINAQFIDTVFPVLFKKCTHFLGEKQFFQRLFCVSAQNPYLISFYNHSFSSFFPFYASIHFPAEDYYSYLLNVMKANEFVLEGKLCKGNNYEENNNYLKVTLTPPVAWFKKTTKKISNILCTFMLCVKQVNKNSKNNKGPLLVPKALIKDSIAPYIIHNNIPKTIKEWDKKTITRYQKVMKPVENHWNAIQNVLKVDDSDTMSYNDFHLWVENYWYCLYKAYGPFKQFTKEKK